MDMEIICVEGSCEKCGSWIGKHDDMTFCPSCGFTRMLNGQPHYLAIVNGGSCDGALIECSFDGKECHMKFPEKVSNRIRVGEHLTIQPYRMPPGMAS